MGVHELPADALELRDVMAVDDVDPLGPLFTDQRGPFVGALTAADDEHSRGPQIFEVHEVTGMSSNPGRH